MIAFTGWPGALISALLFYIFISDIIIFMRHPKGLSGDFHISIVTSGGLAVATIATAGSLLQVGALLFIALQGVLGYGLAGVHKFLSPEWRNGSAITDILSTYTWGHGGLYQVMKGTPTFAFSCAWLVILFESLFPLVLVVPQEFLTIFFIGGVIFHLSVGVFMRLNGFLIAFPATYPAMLFANDVIRSLV
jgi:hypothetical protein